MNPLEEYPHLFANGKFKVRVGQPYYPNPQAQSLLGCDFVTRLPIIVTEVSNWVPVKSCTLIARPISDMTRGEITALWPKEKLSSIEQAKQMIFGREIDRKARKAIGNLANDNLLLAKEERYLLSIGVYPFDQSHFEDGTVIDSTTL